MLKPEKVSTPADFARLEAWFEEAVQDRDFADHAFALTEACFARAGRVPRLPDSRVGIDRWQFFCWHLFHALWGPIEAGDQDGLVKDVFKTMSDYCLLKCSVSPAWRFAIILNVFWERDCINDRVKSLLPTEMIAVMPELETIFAKWQEAADERENEMIRMGQMGY